MISAATGDGISNLLAKIVKTLEKPVEFNAEEEIETVPVKKYIYEPEFKIRKEDGVFVSAGKKSKLLRK